ncbi:hypothetical protein L202_05655 [Cryptococcus amylolentus CBS 6039]|uniref:Uncharacterized protein n=1 Tax=Cryptococcus amylolentus CBS 6039 TaxID=1295533 RepID=A0A1E3HLC1_9TREE|nr:hypothetical protein L202_05655 [Cryptococcus amylolentus CBS 6039]ODN77124.1 hypothetical protein L202_05655 [Cryptococcus amylolentus CBS 6039]
MTLLSRPSRSYATVDHDPDGLAGIGSAPGAGASTSGSVLGSGGTRRGSGSQVGRDSGSALGGVHVLKKGSKKGDGFKTYRPPISETHLRRSLGYDPHPTSSFAPLPSAFQSSRVKKEAALAGQRAEADHLLAPGYNETRRTAGGLAGGLRGSSSQASFNPPHSANSGRRQAGVYLDSYGKLHDTEYDPFAGLTNISRDKSRRRSAFGKSRRSSVSSDSSSSSAESQARRRQSHDTMRSVRDEEEVRRRLREKEREMEKQRDDVSLYVQRRRSIMSEREREWTGRGSPSIRSIEEGPMGSGQSFMTGRRSQANHYYPSPLSPQFAGPSFANNPSTASNASTRTPNTSTFSGINGEGTPPEKISEMTQAKSPVQALAPPPLISEPPPKERKKSKVEVRDGVTKVIGFDGPAQSLSPPTDQLGSLSLQSPDPSSGLTPPPPISASASVTSRGSMDMPRSPRPPGEPARTRHPTRTARDDIYPETPAQTKRRQDKERQRILSGAHHPSHISSHHAHTGKPSPLAINTNLAPNGERVLPEIEIVSDDDPRVVVPKEGKTTRVQRVHDHVIRNPLHHHSRKTSQASNSTLGTLPLPPTMPAAGGYGLSGSSSLNDLNGSGKARSTTGSRGGGSSFMEESGGYLPSRWAQGDKKLRKTEEEREAYRPREWGEEEGTWHPTAKDQVKRNFKDIATSARFSLYRTKKALMRKAEL